MIYKFSDLPIEQLLMPASRAADAVARLDDRIGQSVIREGVIGRFHFADAAASLFVDGDLVHLEDLVLHDAGMDIRAPSHALVIAHMVLRSRRLILDRDPDWALTQAGIAHLRGRDGATPMAQERKNLDAKGGAEPALPDFVDNGGEAADPFDRELAAIDAVLARSQSVLDTIALHGLPEDTGLAVYDRDWDEEGRLAEWLALVRASVDLPPLLRAALLIDAWTSLDVLQHGAWLGRLLVAAMLRQAGATCHHLLAINVGLREIRWERRRSPSRRIRLIAMLEAMERAGRIGLAEHDRLMSARHLLGRKLVGRRSNSKLPQLVDLVLARPMVSAGMIARALKVTPQGAVVLAESLGLREMTGRERFRAWGIV